MNPEIPWYIYNNLSYNNAEFVDWSAEAACRAEAGFWVNQTIITQFYAIITSL